MADWRNKTILVTGGSGGMGRAVAELFLVRGAIVYLADINTQGLAEAKSDLTDLGGRVETIQADMARVQDCSRMVKTAVADTGRLDVLINTAGIWIEGPAPEMSEESWDRMMDINLKGAYFACTAAYQHLAKVRGSIVNVSSDAGISASTTGRASLYSISKAGLIMLTKTLAIEFAQELVRVNCVAPGDVDTPMLAGQARDYGGDDPEGYLNQFLTGLPQGQHARFVTAREVAQTIFFLASPEVEAITGATISIDWGSTAGL